MGKALWYCCRQRAGPLVKECRALRPRLGPDDTGEDVKAKRDIQARARCAVNRRQVDRLELRLALFGWTGDHYTLTFDDEHLPDNFAGVRRCLRAFFARWRRAAGGNPLDYIYAIEGLHGERRYHVHLVADYYQLGPVLASALWRQGMVDDEPVLLRTGGYRRLAEYLNKERTDGVIIPIGRHPWSCSRSLNARLPAAERWMDSDGGILIPDDAIWARRGGVENDFGAYYYGSWIEPDDSRACARVRARLS